MMLGRTDPPKQPREVKDYDITYTDWLVDGDTLFEITAEVECLTGNDTSLVVDKTEFTADRAKFWLSGGASGNRYKLTALADTNLGRRDESEIIVVVKDF